MADALILAAAELRLNSVYKALDPKQKQIRVIDLEPVGNDANSQISATLRNVSLDDLPEYETISYAWGDASQQSDIQLNGTKFRVPSTAWQALRRLRHANRSRTLWVDSICVNQDDVPERSYQVAMMGEIYRRTWRNLVWLGEHSDPDFEIEVVSMLTIVVDNMRSETADLKNLLQVIFNSNERPLFSGTGIPNLKLDPLLRLYSLSWFTRLWVIQEIVLAPESSCHLGAVVFQLDDVLLSAMWLRYKHRHLDIPPAKPMTWHPAIAMWYARGKTPNGWYTKKYGVAKVSTLSTLVADSYQQQTSEPRDRIYGLLGLVGLDGNLALRDPCPVVPDYENSVEKTYRDAMVVIINTSGLDRLQDIHYRCDADFDATCTSWLPKWDKRRDALYDAVPLDFFFEADKGTRLSRAKPFASGTELSCWGVSLGKIVLVSGVLQRDHVNNGSPLIESVKCFKDSLLDRSLFYIDLDSAMNWTVIAGTNAYGSPANNHDADDYHSFERYVRAHGKSPSVPRGCDIEEIPDVELRDASRFYAALWPMSMHRRLFYTEMGYIGLGPGILKIGDSACTLGGLRWPAILRSQQEETSKHRFVGLSYVAEMMHGGVLRNREKTGLLPHAVKKFVIM